MDPASINALCRCPDPLDDLLAEVSRVLDANRRDGVEIVGDAHAPQRVSDKREPWDRQHRGWDGLWMAPDMFARPLPWELVRRRECC